MEKRSVALGKLRFLTWPLVKNPQPFRGRRSGVVATYRACSSSPFQLGGGLQAAVLLPVVPAGGAQSTLHVGRPPGVPLLRLSCCGGPQENTALVCSQLGTVEFTHTLRLWAESTGSSATIYLFFFISYNTVLQLPRWAVPVTSRFVPGLATPVKHIQSRIKANQFGVCPQQKCLCCFSRQTVPGL